MMRANIQMQKTGAGMACQDDQDLPAFDLERYEPSQACLIAAATSSIRCCRNLS